MPAARDLAAEIGGLPEQPFGRTVVMLHLAVEAFQAKGQVALDIDLAQAGGGMMGAPQRVGAAAAGAQVEGGAPARASMPKNPSSTKSR